MWIKVNIILEVIPSSQGKMGKFKKLKSQAKAQKDHKENKFIVGKFFFSNILKSSWDQAQDIEQALEYYQ